MTLLPLFGFLCMTTWAMGARLPVAREMANSEDMAERLRYTVNEDISQSSAVNRLTALLPGTPFVKQLAKNSAQKVLQLRLGQSIDLKCETVGMPSPIAYWMKNGLIISTIETNKLPPTNNVVELMGNEGRPTLETSIIVAKLSLRCLSAEDAGVYQCVGDNGVNKIVTETKLVIEGEDENSQCQSSASERIPPIIAMHTDMRMEYVGNDVQLNCRAEGQPKPTVQWFIEDKPIANGRNYTILSNGDLLVKRTDIVDSRPFRQFTCRASNDVGSDTAVMILLSMKPSD